MVEVPVSTVEKPLTALDYIACLVQCNSIEEVRDYAERCPLEIRQDERFTRSVAWRLAEIRKNRRTG